MQTHPQKTRLSASVKRRRPATKSKPEVQWTVLCYLAGDIVAPLADQLQHDLQEILAAGASAKVSVAVQFDGHDGGLRYLLPQKTPVERLGHVNSGAPAVLADFLRWGLSVCPGERVALVLGGLNALDPREEEVEQGRAASRVFTICRDDSCGGYMDVVDLGAVIREVLGERGRDHLEMLAVDSCHTQFLELAYELEGIVQVLLASQTTVPGSGWDYTKVLHTWRQTVETAREGPDAVTVARALLPAVVESYRTTSPVPCVVSALDLRRLDDVARAFDTLCIGMLQVLGEGLIWQTRHLLLERFDSPAMKAQGDAYDCGSYFLLLGASLDYMADEATQGWLGTTLQRASGAAFRRFCEAVARRLEQASAKDSVRMQLLIATLRSQDHIAKGKSLLAEVGHGITARLDLLAANAPLNQRQIAAAAARECDKLLEEAIRAEFRLLPAERRFDFERLKDSVETARRLAKQSRQAAMTLLGSAIEADFDNAAEKQNVSRAGFIIEVRSTAGELSGWPRWSGVSLYRPPKLDELMNASYQRFAFHQRVHWAAMLGAANLIEQHPRALWRLVSSLLATGAAGTRRDLLRRLTGNDSVVWGLRDQFRVMAPASTLTLSLEKRRRMFDDGDGREDAGGRENYLLRLESATRGAVITEQRSRVQPKMMERALQELADVLSADAATADVLRRLRSIGGLLGEDVLQTLSRTLEEERQSALDGSANTNVHLQLQIPRELMRYPWELLHHHGEWLCERFAIGRQVFMQTGTARRVTRRQQGRIRPLIIGDPLFDPKLDPRPRQLPGARDEAEQVAGWFARLSDELGEVIDFELERDTRIHTRVTVADFRELLRSGQYDIIHFAGHGVFRAADPESSAWLLSDGELWALEIRNTLADQSAPPWLVYANACESAMESDRPSPAYQGNVFGLATAFINQGVAAYIAPLWPIDDLLAQQIALDFYEHLLCDRFTLGESLRRAKADARRMTYPDDQTGPLPEDAAWAGLGWASLVLYGDPTEELFQALAGSGRKEGVAAEPTLPTQINVTSRASAPKSPAVSAPKFLHAPDHVMADWVRGPAVTPLPAGTRGDTPIGKDEYVLELVEEAGLRRWRLPASAPAGKNQRGAGGEADDGLPGSDLAKLMRDDRVRNRLGGNRGVIRVIGRWLMKGFAGGLTGLVREYDREQVANEGLLLIPDGDPKSMVPVTRDAFPKSSVAAKNDRVLLLIHGTFSRTASPVEGFGPSFLGWARERYRAVLGLDHWTLCKTPLENAKMLAEQLRILEPNLLEGRRLDIITHSRGGLVARAFTELLDGAPAVRNLIFLGTPNCGTDLANPKNWGALADTLVNLTGVDHAELFGRLAALLARLAIRAGEEKIPGILAQNPLMAADKNSFLHLLQQRNAGGGGVRHAVITAEFEPAPLIPNLKGLWQAAKAAGVDTALGHFFADANDLVVNTAHVWCIEQGSDQRATLPDFLDAHRVLAFLPSNSTLELPAKVEAEIALGVHHCNLFGQKTAQARLKQWLTES